MPDKAKEPSRPEPRDHRLFGGVDATGASPFVIRAEREKAQAKRKAERAKKPLLERERRTVEAAFRTENTVGSTINALAFAGRRAAAREKYGFIRDYSPIDHVSRDPRFDSDWDKFALSGSPQETEEIKAQILVERADRQELQDAGLSGLVYQGAAAIFDPVNVAPGGQVVRGGKAARVLFGGVKEASVAAATEGYLTLTQLERDDQAENIVTSALIGSALPPRAASPTKARPPTARETLFGVESAQSMAIRESDRGARLAAGEASPAARSAVASFAGEDGLGALKAAVRAVTVDLADEAAAVDAGDLVPKQAAAVLRVLGADARGALDDKAMADIVSDLKRLTTAPDALSMERRAAILRLQTTIRGLRRGLAARGAPIGAGGRGAADGMLTAADRLTIAWRDINRPPPERGGPEPDGPNGAVAAVGASPAIAERLRRDSLSPEEAEVVTAADGRLTDFEAPADLAALELGRDRMLRTLEPNHTQMAVDPLTAMRRIAADPAHAELADAAAWAIGSGPTGRRLKDSLEGLAGEVMGIDPAEARVAVRALDRSLNRFWQGNGIVAASWDRQLRELVGETLDDQLADALINLAEGSPLVRAQAQRLSIFGLDGDLGRAAADQIRRFPPQADGPRLWTPGWTDRRAARAVDRARTAETASALGGGSAAHAWRVKALVDLLTALGERLVNHFGERADTARTAPATTVLDVLAPEIAKGAVSALLDAIKGEDEPETPSDPGRAFAQALVRSGLAGWLFETPPPTVPDQPLPGLDSPVGRMLQNLALLATALGDGTPPDPVSQDLDWLGDEPADTASPPDGSEPILEWGGLPSGDAIDSPVQDWDAP